MTVYWFRPSIFHSIFNKWLIIWTFHLMRRTWAVSHPDLFQVVFTIDSLNNFRRIWIFPQFEIILIMFMYIIRTRDNKSNKRLTVIWSAIRFRTMNSWNSVYFSNYHQTFHSIQMIYDRRKNSESHLTHQMNVSIKNMNGIHFHSKNICFSSINSKLANG